MVRFGSNEYAPTLHTRLYWGDWAICFLLRTDRFDIIQFFVQLGPMSADFEARRRRPRIDNN
jgi:hypothetical protein